MAPIRIVSGGQTGVDRAALDAALETGADCGGWCPRERRAEDGPIPPRYPLRETESADYAVRTRRNVRDSDATLIVVRGMGQVTAGTRLTAEEARRTGRPLLIVDLDVIGAPDDAATEVARWITENGVATLNVAGPRESKSPGIYRDVRLLMGAAIRAVIR